MDGITTITPQAAARELLARRKARRDLGAYHQKVWWMPDELLIGRHTRAIWDRLERAVDDFREGVSTFLVIQVPFRHGKSDIVSIALPTYFLGRCADLHPDMIVTGYGADLMQDFSRKCRNVIKSPAYQSVFPEIKLAVGHDTIKGWGPAGGAGKATFTGLGGAITGRGAHLIVVDDFCKHREEAESETYRNRTWLDFTESVLTRRAPTSIVVVCATPWHVDDIVGRIKNKMATEENFPAFQFLRFPAQSDEYRTSENPHGYLFPERFDSDYYESQRASLGSYSAAALLDCDPIRREGAMFKNVDHVHLHEDIKDFPDTRYVRFWDLASTAKERIKDSPDYTAGALCGITKKDGVTHLWVKNVCAMQEEAPKRDAKIRALADTDGGAVQICVESVAGYKDTYASLRDILRGKRVVLKVDVSSEKVVRAAPLEAIFEAGNVHILRAPWNDLFLRHFTEFPNGLHDDIVDAVSGAYAYLTKHHTGAISRKDLGI